MVLIQHTACIDFEMTGSEVAFMNISDADNQTESEFTHWRPVVSLLLLCLWLFSILLATQLLAIKKSSFNTVQSALHIYVLVLNILVRVCSAMIFSSFIPPAI